MNYIVLDLEWNQCPQGKEKEEALLPFEIIEIGAVKMDETHRILDTFHEVVRPQVYTSLHYMTKEIISLQEDQIKNGRSFPEAVAGFFSWCGNDAAFCTWGPSDLYELQRNLSWYKIPIPFPFPLLYYDIQKVFSIVYEDRRTRRNLEYVVDFLHIKKQDTFHSACSDAMYTARVMEFLDDEDIRNNTSVDYYRTPSGRRQEIYLTYSTYSKFVSRPFADKADVLKDRVVASTTCYLCRKAARKRIRWFASGSHNYLCLSYCEEHGWLKGKIRLRQRGDGMFYAIKTLRLIKTDEAYVVREKQEFLRLRRRLRRNFQNYEYK